MNKTRREMMETGENLGWCVPFQIRSTDQMNQWDVVFTLSDNAVASIRINGEDREIDAWTTAEILEMLSDPYNRDFTTEELSCSRCPWFWECEAMGDGDAS